jgi:hypothetical protein
MTKYNDMWNLQSYAVINFNFYCDFPRKYSAVYLQDKI